MGQPTVEQTLVSQPEESPARLALDDGARVGVIGGGPAGSFFGYFLLDMADRLGADLQVDIYEPRDFATPGPPGCNMCGGIVSESLVQMLAAEGINLPPTVVQRGIEAYTLHMDVGSVRIETPLHEKRIGAVYRGPGPRDLKAIKWEGLDGHLQGLAVGKGAEVVRRRVAEVGWADGRPQIITRGGSPQTYDLVAVTAGVNSAVARLFKGVELEYHPGHDEDLHPGVLPGRGNDSGGSGRFHARLSAGHPRAGIRRHHPQG